jgi:hypothetical protein
MSSDMTPEKAKKEDIKNLIRMANLYRAGTGVHTVVTNEINRRNDVRKLKLKIFGVILLGIIGLLFVLIKNYI